MTPKTAQPLPPLLANDPELLALVRCLSVTLGSAHPQSAIDSLANPNLEWPKFIRQIHRHRLVQQVYRSIQSLPENPLGPAKLTQLQAFSNKLSLRQLAATAYSRDVLDTLNKHHIESIVLKGPAIACLLYGSPEKRECADLDILVRESDFHAAENALAQAGFHYTADDAHIPGDRLARHKRHTYHLHYSSDKMSVELHWRLSGLSFMHPFANDKLFERKQTFEIASVPVASLGYDDLVQHQSIHGIAHGWNQLRLLYEIALTRKLSPELFDTIPQRISQPQSQRCFQISTTLVQNIFNYGPSRQPNRLKAYRSLVYRVLTKEDVSPDKTSTTLERCVSISIAAHGPANKFRYLKYLSSWSSLNHSLQLPKPLQFLYPLIGPFAWLKKQLTKALSSTKHSK